MKEKDDDVMVDKVMRIYHDYGKQFDECKGQCRFCGREFNTIIQTNNVGLREDKDFNGEKIDIGFVGDSFTFGHGVNYGERYSDLLRSYYPSKNILSLSRLNGWTTPHYYLFLKKNPQYIPHILIMGLFPYNDIHSDILGTNFIFDKEGELVSAKSSKTYVNDEGTLVRKDSFIMTRKVMDFLLSFNTGKLIVIAYGRLKGIYHSGRKLNHLSSLQKGELNKTNLNPDYLIFASRHTSKTARPAFLVHTTGNWGKNIDFGGEPQDLSLASALLHKAGFLFEFHF